MICGGGGGGGGGTHELVRDDNVFAFFKYKNSVSSNSVHL